MEARVESERHLENPGFAYKFPSFLYFGIMLLHERSRGQVESLFRTECSRNGLTQLNTNRTVEDRPRNDKVGFTAENRRIGEDKRIRPAGSGQVDLQMTRVGE